MFQSLLWWIGLAGPAGHRRRPWQDGVSILVVVDRARWGHRAGLDRSSLRVSILVVVDRARWGRSGRPGRGRDVGFNPCCGGSGSLGSGSKAFDHARTRVSILVVVDRARWEHGRQAGSIGDHRVSILVVVDRARWDRRPADAVVTLGGFNPCCGGSGSLGTVCRLIRQPAIAMFQSLLWWIGLAGTLRDRRGIVSPRQVSILVVVDRARWAPMPVGRWPSGFQSLLWWIGLAGDSTQSGHRERCMLRFQSLLWWIGLAGFTQPPNRSRRAHDVSILVVVDRARWVASSRASDSSVRWFQSLLWWIGLAGPERLDRSLGTSHVSILVVVDRARWDADGATHRRVVLEFQSLLWWIGLAGDRARSGRVSRRAIVSILVVVDRARWGGRSPASRR